MFRPLLAAKIDRFEPDGTICELTGSGAVKVSRQLHFPILASPKIDGIRCLNVGFGPQTRSGKSIENHHVRRLLAEAAVGLDGEIVVGGPTNPACFNLTQSAVMSQQGTPDFEFFVFDAIPAHAGEPFAKRLQRAKTQCEALTPHFPWLKFLRHEAITTPVHLEAYEAKAVELGFEGVMLRDPQGRYKNNRSTFREGLLYKLKRFEDDEAEIVGYEELMRNYNDPHTSELGFTKRSTAQAGLIPAGSLGAWIVSSPKWQHTFKLGSGSGFTADLRDYYWERRQTFIGKRASFKYQAHGSLDRPRIPQFKGIRED